MTLRGQLYVLKGTISRTQQNIHTQHVHRRKFYPRIENCVSLYDTSKVSIEYCSIPLSVRTCTSGYVWRLEALETVKEKNREACEGPICIVIHVFPWIMTIIPQLSLASSSFFPPPTSILSSLYFAAYDGYYRTSTVSQKILSFLPPLVPGRELLCVGNLKAHQGLFTFVTLGKLCALVHFRRFSFTTVLSSKKGFNTCVNIW